MEPIATGGTALGLIPEVDGRIQERSIELAPGDKAILFTDGLTEAANSNEAEFGLEGLSASVSRHGELAPAELIQAIRKDVAAFTGPGEPNDDMTLMVLERSAS